MSPCERGLIHGREVYDESKSLAIYVIKKYRNQTQGENAIGDRLYELCMQVKYKHQLFFENIGEELGLNEENFNGISRVLMLETLIDTCNYGRIVSIYTLCIALVIFCEENGIKDKADSISNNVAMLMYSKLDWFEENNGWSGFIEHFDNLEEKNWRKALMLFSSTNFWVSTGLNFSFS